MTKLLHDCIAGVHATEHSSQVLSIVCASTCTAIGILCHEHTYDMLVGIRDMCSSERFMRIYYWYNSDAYWGCRTFHPSPSPVFHTYFYVFICFVHIQPAVLGRGGVGKLSYSVITAQSNFVYFTHKYSYTRFRVIYAINCYTDDIPPLIDSEQIVTIFILNLLFKFSDML
jgi:hypothetical protein